MFKSGLNSESQHEVATNSPPGQSLVRLISYSNCPNESEFKWDYSTTLFKPSYYATLITPLGTIDTAGQPIKKHLQERMEGKPILQFCSGLHDKSPDTGQLQRRKTVKELLEPFFWTIRALQVCREKAQPPFQGPVQRDRYGISPNIHDFLLKEGGGSCAKYMIQ